MNRITLALVRPFLLAGLLLGLVSMANAQTTHNQPALCGTVEVKPAPDAQAVSERVEPDGTTTLEIDLSSISRKFGGLDASTASGDSKGASQSAKGTEIKGDLNSSAPNVALPGGAKATGGDTASSFEAEVKMPEPQTIRILLAVIGVAVAGVGGFLIWRGLLGIGLGMIGGGLFLIAACIFPVIWWILGILGLLSLIAVGVIALVRYAGQSKVRDAFEEIVDGIASLKPKRDQYPEGEPGKAQYDAAVEMYQRVLSAQSKAQSPGTAQMVAAYRTAEGRST